MSEARFKHYITQDAHYLIGFGRALALAGAKAPNPDRIVQFAKAAEVAIIVERELHDSFFRQYQIAAQVFTETRALAGVPSLRFVSARDRLRGAIEVLLGALLPCFWIYAEVGLDIHSRAAAGNPYRAWIDTYAGEEFHAAVRAMIAATDEAAEAASRPCASECTPPSTARPSSNGCSGTRLTGWKVAGLELVRISATSRRGQLAVVKGSSIEG